MLKSLTENQKHKIISKLENIFVDIENVCMAFTAKGEQNLIFKCPAAGCERKERNLKRHLMQKKHGWTEAEASRHVSFCTRF